jgi:calcium-dependent protein kinase
MSPEMFKGSFTEKSDIWSIGVMAYQLMTGELPYRGDNILIQAHVVCNPRRYPQWELLSKYKWSTGARFFCQQLLIKDEATRPSADEALQDNWLAKTAADSGNEKPSDTEKLALQEQHLQSHLMKMAMAAVTSQLNLSQMHHLNNRFEHYDSSGDGRLSHAEMRQVLEDVGVRKGEDLELVIESLDSDRSGLIEYSEFVAGCVDIASSDVKNHLKVVFRIFDLDGSGSISLEELRQVLTAGPNTAALPTRPSSQQGTREADTAAAMLPDGKTAEEVMEELDRDQTGKVDFAEFEKYLLGEHERAGQQLHAEQAAQAAAVEGSQRW